MGRAWRRRLEECWARQLPPTFPKDRTAGPRTLTARVLDREAERRVLDREEGTPSATDPALARREEATMDATRKTADQRERVSRNMVCVVW
jgi:hypothetical protein